jgi:hypothetical protein
LKSLEKNLEKELKARKDRYKNDQEDLLKARGEKPGSRLKFWSKGHAQEINDNRFWALVNVESLREFVKYGANKVLDQIRIRTHANIVAREEIARMKKKQEGVDIKAMGFTIIILVIAGAMAFIIVQNFFNYNTAQQENIALKRQIGDTAGQLAACQSELAAIRPESPNAGTGQKVVG